MRERDTTHSYWYIPSAPKENYSLLVMETSGMMMMASGDDSPSGRLSEKGPDWFLVDTKTFGNRTYHLGLPRRVLEYLRIYRVKRRCGRRPRRAPPTMACHGGCCPPWAPSLVLLRPSGCLLVQKKLPKSFAVFGLRLVFIFCDVKNKQNNSNWHWALCQ
jgi:hypothetical protein